MKRQNYYILHRDELEKYKVIGSLTPASRAIGFRRIWAIEM